VIVGRIELRIRQFNRQSQQLLRDLNEKLPDGLFAQSEGGSVWVWFPESMHAGEAESTVSTLLSELSADVTGVSLN